MKREKNYKTARLIEALEYIDVRFIEEAAEKIKTRPTGQAFYGKPSRSKALRQFLALAACVLLLSAAIPAITYLANHLPDIVAFFIGDETTGTDPELTHPETPPVETTVPSPETTEETTEIYHETTEEPWPSTTAPREETASPEETTAEETTEEETTSPPEPEYDGSRGLEYSIGGNAEIGWYMTLDGIGTCTDVDIVVASYYKGYPVKYIEQGAFYGQTQIKSIRLSDTVERIDSQAFRNCTSLESIYIGSGFREFNSNAFWGCGNISNIEVDPDNKFFEGVNCIIEKSRKALVRGCRTTVIPADGSVTRIDGLAFIDVHGLTSITIPEGVTSLGEDAFIGCPDLKSIHFSSTVNSFELVSVMGCDALEVITVDSKNPRFYSSGNCVIEKETGTLFLGCAGSVIPNDGSIKKIGYYAFGSNDSLTNIVIPNGVTHIDGYAFAGCAGLKEIILPDSVTQVGFGVFSGCSSLERFEFSENTKTIGSWVFDNCVNLREVKMPKYGSIGEGVFSGCSSLESIVIPIGQDILHIGTFSACINLKSVVLPDTLTQIHSPFPDCTSLKSITIPAGVTIIEHQAFIGCTSLTEFNFKGTASEWKKVTKENGWNRGCPFTVIHCSDGDLELYESDGSQGLEYKINDDGKSATLIGMGSCKDKDVVVASSYKGYPVTDIRYDAFAGSWITSVTLSDSVIRVDYSVFMNCYKNLKQIHISKSVLEFGHDAFSFLQNLESITVPPENPRYYVAGNCLIDKETKEVLRGWGDFTIPDDGSVTSIAEGAFSCCNIVNVVLPKGITKIDSSAFAFCASLKRISLPEGLLTIGDGSFDSCTSLESITLPDSLTKIDSGAFAYCENLSSIKIGRHIERIEKEVFYSSAVKDIQYAGTMSEWNSIKKPDNWNYNCFATVIHCSDGDVLAEPITYDEATELARQYWSPIESGYFVCYASDEMYLLVRPDEVIVDRIYIDRYTGEISVPKLTYPDIPDSLLKVLLNETTYIRQFDYESEGYFKDTILDYPTAETGSFGYAVCDLDGDGKAELILSSMQYEIVLREFEGKVYGYLFDFRSLLDLKTDGSFNFTSNAGMTCGTARLSFDGTKYVYHELTRRETADDGSISYFVDDKKVTKEEFDAREALLSQEEAPYEHLAIYPLRSWFPGG